MICLKCKRDVQACGEPDPVDGSLGASDTEVERKGGSVDDGSGTDPITEVVVEQEHRAQSPVRRERRVKPRHEASELGVGARLRLVRERAGLTQRELAKRSGITNTTISLIEQEAHSPSLASLHRLLSAVPISMADFFALPISQQNVLFHDHEDLMVVSRGAADLRVMSAERRDKTLQMFFERYEPGAGTGDEAIMHEGETAALVIRGTIEVTVAGVTRQLKAGGGWQVIGNEPYSLRNIGKTVAVVVCACTPPMI
jgi:transcriptional regulator with XRE-family HTH domain